MVYPSHSEHAIKRPCPVCLSTSSEQIRDFIYLDQTIQVLVSCCDCGMVYASESPQADYVERSKYAVPSAIGSGETEHEHKRFDELVSIISSIQSDRRANILDIGCARGGLLEAFKRARYANVSGVDPSKICVDACRSKGLNAYQGMIGDIKPAWDCIVLSHVLEHLWDVNAALCSISSALADSGFVYIETPNAMKYEALVPYMDVNREHINHFSMHHLSRSLNAAGLSLEAAGCRDDFSHFSLPLPSMYVIGRKTGKTLCERINDYLLLSGHKMPEIENVLSEDLYNCPQCAIWGYGEFAQTLLQLPLFKTVEVAQIIDRDPAKWGETAMGVQVSWPSSLRPDLPIVVASMVNRDSILSAIKNMGLTNRVITVDEP